MGILSWGCIELPLLQIVKAQLAAGRVSEAASPPPRSR
jgi:hypothetical protein